MMVPVDSAGLAAVLFEHFRTPALAAYGGVAGVRGEGRWLDAAAQGWAVAYAADGDRTRLLPEEERERVGRETVFDIASLTKLFTAITVIRLAAAGVVDLDEPIARNTPEMQMDSRITPTHLLTHTAGFAEDVALWRTAADQRLALLLSQSLVHEPGSAFSYSCIGYAIAGVWISAVTGRPLDQLFTEYITAPLGMADTCFAAPGPVPDAAATEFQMPTARGLVRGEPHDELCWSLGAVAGNAGLFSTLDDCGRLVDALLQDPSGCLQLPTWAVQKLTVPQLPHDPRRGFDQAVGFRVNAPSFMGPMAGRRTIGHTGFTGTSIVIDLETRLSAVLLTNRVHPARDQGIDPLRRKVAAECLAWSST